MLPHLESPPGFNSLLPLANCKKNQTYIVAGVFPLPAGNLCNTKRRPSHFHTAVTRSTCRWSRQQPRYNQCEQRVIRQLRYVHKDGEEGSWQNNQLYSQCGCRDTDAAAANKTEFNGVCDASLYINPEFVTAWNLTLIKFFLYIKGQSAKSQPRLPLFLPSTWVFPSSKEMNVRCVFCSPGSPTLNILMLSLFSRQTASVTLWQEVKQHLIITTAFKVTSSHVSWKEVRLQF